MEAQGPALVVCHGPVLLLQPRQELKRCNMTQNCLLGLKYLMFVFNLLFWLAGCGVLGVGIWLAVTQGNFATLSATFPFLSAANLLIGIGSVATIVGFLGCVGAIKQNKCMLLSFFILLLLIFMVEVVAGILVCVYRAQIDAHARDDLTDGLQLFRTDGNIGLTNAWSIVQTDFRCCGVSNYTDWFKVFNATQVPDSCCREYTVSCGLHSPETWWRDACYERVKMWLQDNLLVIGAFALCTALIQVVGLTLAMVMYCRVLRASDYFS